MLYLKKIFNSLLVIYVFQPCEGIRKYIFMLQVVKLLDSKRSQNVGIFMSSLHMTAAEIENSKSSLLLKRSVCSKSSLLLKRSVRSK